jgi:hypothetical protein
MPDAPMPMLDVRHRCAAPMRTDAAPMPGRRSSARRCFASMVSEFLHLMSGTRCADARTPDALDVRHAMRDVPMRAMPRDATGPPDLMSGTGPRGTGPRVPAGPPRAPHRSLRSRVPFGSRVTGPHGSGSRQPSAPANGAGLVDGQNRHPVQAAASAPRVLTRSGSPSTMSVSPPPSRCSAPGA